jgi:hypothetical protein
MLFESVLVRELKIGETKQTQKKYPIIVSQTGELWRLFNNEHVELNKGYVIGYELSEDKQYKNVKEVRPLQNIWLQQALKELASKSDISKNISVSLGYAKDLTIGQVIKLEEMFDWADKIYKHITDKTNSEFDLINSSGINPKDIK